MRLQLVEQVLAELRDDAAGVGEPGQAGDQVEAARDALEVADDLVQLLRIAHATSLRAELRRTGDAATLWANTPDRAASAGNLG